MFVCVSLSLVTYVFFIQFPIKLQFLISEVYIQRLGKTAGPCQCFCKILWSKLYLKISVLLWLLSSLYDVCIPYSFPHILNFVVMETCMHLKHNVYFSCLKCKRTISNSVKNYKRTICLTQQHHLYEKVRSFNQFQYHIIYTCI